LNNKNKQIKRGIMEVYLRKNIAKIGLEGEIIKVGDGFARNYLIPKGFAIEVTTANKSQFEKKQRAVENRKEVIATETSMFADKINNTTVSIARKMHDNGSLYGSVNAVEIVDALALQGISIGKSQVEFERPLKAKGTFKVIINLTKRLKGLLTVNVISE
jgi:large subunit ribosomal protein L9